ncbi:hypothetical protein Q9L58_006051 [Maublancomyces gigas]|uniref:DNA polymerase epsilon subunit D n=1 Tax=Discina gigas TaxID=1032678 RepID=A0ABR3GGZ0_9PEZI
MPRKADAGTDGKDGAGNSAGGNGVTGAGGNPKEGLSIDDQTLPKSIVTRLAKGVLPQNTNVQKDAILALSKGGTVFINYLCATANDQAKVQGRKTINPGDILEAMRILEFGDFLPRLEAELAKFNQIASEKRAATKKTPKPSENPAVAGSGPVKHSPSDASSNGNDSPPAAKKLRVGAATDPGIKQAGGTSLIASSVPVRGWGDEDEEGDEEMGDEEEDDEVEESESEEPDEEESDGVPDEADTEVNHNQGEDEALDNGADSS